MVFCAVFVGHAQSLIRPQWKSDFNRLLFVNQQFVVIIWILAVVLLGMGGIVREKLIGTSSLTLSLPVSRARLLSVRVGMGVMQAVALAVAPWITVCVILWLAHKPIGIDQIGSYVLLLIGGGLAYFGMAVLVSSLVAGEYTAPALAIGVVLLAATVFDAWLRSFNLWRLVTGDLSIDRSTFLLSRHLPLLGILASLSVSALLVLASISLIQKRDF
jgi:ABC-type transport system involved in multi-copper enzyme maturation permease subunit